MNVNRFIKKNESKLDRMLTQHSNDISDIIFAKIHSSESFDAEKWQWEYTIVPASMDETDLSTAVKNNDKQYLAYSISELGNTTTTAAYGVELGYLPETIRPVKIPNGTPVVCVPQRSINGKFYYLIINTQAISGPCA